MLCFFLSYFAAYNLLLSFKVVNGQMSCAVFLFSIFYLEMKETEKKEENVDENKNLESDGSHASLTVLIPAISCQNTRLTRMRKQLMKT